tara:strand:- start:22 stop:684 length:663 start_codon:yes stop_codon:yes gene_type:complete
VTSTTEFNLRGDGYGLANNTWNDNALDYAEYFENTTADPITVGVAVVLDNGKVRAYTDSDDDSNIIGITRPKKDAKGPSAHGMAWNHWYDRYLTDDYGRYIKEDVTVWDWDEVLYTEDDELPDDKNVGDVKIEGGSCYERDAAEDWVPPTGATSSTQSENKQNPDYDESLGEGYSSREDRDEWSLIGLLGQVPIAKGQPTRPTWIKMKDISDAVEMWMIR